MTETTSLSGDERAEETSRAARDAEEEEQMKEGERDETPEHFGKTCCRERRCEETLTPVLSWFL